MDIESDALWLGLNRPRVIWEPLPPAVWNVPDMRAAIGRRDIGAVYKILQKYGVSQRRIAALTGQSQSEVSEILGGRRVHSYDLLVRICEGLGIPRGWMGLAYVSRDGEDSASRGEPWSFGPSCPVWTLSGATGRGPLWSWLLRSGVGVVWRGRVGWRLVGAAA